MQQTLAPVVVVGGLIVFTIFVDQLLGYAIKKMVERKEESERPRKYCPECGQPVRRRSST